MSAKDLCCIVLAYLIGGVCTGYYLVRVRTGADIRAHGSGGVGARNAGRLLGKGGFAATLLGDASKGALAILLAHRFEVSAPAVSLSLVAVVAGHVWPLPLQFRGGRGVATAIGAYLVFDPLLAPVLLVLTLVLMVFRRGATLSGLGAFLLLPPAAYAFERPGHAVAALAGSAAIVLFAHRGRIRQAFAAPLPRKEA